ncbi:MAG: hypothetical protein OHK0039_16090 [Bacteroidia bacterium]
MPQNPYPGRTFLNDEAAFFFGRTRQVSELKRHLCQKRIVSLVGAPNTGKTSLLRAGLVPDLDRYGYKGMAGTRWKTVRFDPGERALDQLVLAVARRNILHPDHKPDPTFVQNLRARFLNRRRGLIEAYQAAVHLHAFNLLLIVDQFEVFLRSTWDETGAQFIRLILEAARDPQAPIYVVLAVRSTELAACASYEGLSEAVMQGSYPLYPLNQAELDEAICRPAEAQGVRLEDPLRQELLKRLLRHPDQLTTLQATMLRVWNAWEKEGGKGPLTLKHLKAAGTIAESTPPEERKSRIQIGERTPGETPPADWLDTQEAAADAPPQPTDPATRAETAFGSMDPAAQILCARLFKSLVWNNRFTGGKAMRQPVIVDVMAAVAGVPITAVMTLVERLRDEDCKLLLPAAPEPLTGTSLIELQEETLIATWPRLQAWLREEATDVERYLTLVEWAHADRSLDPNELEQAMEWRAQRRPSEDWARQYDPRFDATMAYLDEALVRSGTITPPVAVVQPPVAEPPAYDPPVHTQPDEPEDESRNEAARPKITINKRK